LHGESKLWLAVGGPKKTAKKDTLRHVVHEVVLKEIAARRDRFIESAVLAAEGNDKDGPDGTAAAEVAQNCMVCLTLDGEYNVIDNMMLALDKDKKTNSSPSWFIVMKHPAACSMSQQPLDVSPCFRKLKNVWPKMMAAKPAGMRQRYMDKVYEVIKPMCKGSRVVYARWLSLLPNLISEAFCRGFVQQGWEVSGLYPLDLVQIISMCTAHTAMDHEEEAACVAACKMLADVMLEKGQVTDAQIDSALGKHARKLTARPADDVSMKSIRLAVHKKALNHRRTVIISHEKVLEEYFSKQDAPKTPRGAAKVRVCTLFTTVN
jgi:hypothetical protein